MLEKILILVKKIFLKEIIVSFKNPKKTSIVVYNYDSIIVLQYVLKDFDFKLLELSLERVKEINFSPLLLINFFINMIKIKFKSKLSIATIYAFTYLNIAKPKIVITSCDNHKTFSDLAKLLKSKINFIAIQNANRNDYFLNDYKYKNNLVKNNSNLNVHIPNFLCFSQMEIDQYKYYNIDVKNFYKIGSLPMANFFEFKKNNNIKIRKNLFDICFVSEPATGENEKFGSKNIEEGFGKILDYTIKYSKKFNCNFIFASKYKKGFSTINSKLDLHRNELNFYKKFISKENFQYLIKNINYKENYFSSYKVIAESSVAIGVQSTLLKEKISVGEKILSCNMTKFQGNEFPLEGICKIKDCTYDDFEERLSKILSLSSKEYFSSIQDNIEYIMEYNIESNTILKTKKIIETFLI
mgnify:CR=1 FL=1